MAHTGRIFNIQKFSINDGPGIRSTVFFKGCPLQCKWCSNPESQNRNADIADAMEDEIYCGKLYTVEEVMQDVRKDKAFYDKSGGGVTFSGGEVLQQAAFAEELADAARAEGIHVAAETTGYASEAVFSEFIRHIDLLLYDFKHIDRAAHFAGTGVYNDEILRNLSIALKAQKKLIARIPVIPGFNASLDTASAMAEALAKLGVMEVHLLPFHQFGEKKYEQLSIPYEMAGVKQLHAETLAQYRQRFIDAGLVCSFR